MAVIAALKKAFPQVRLRTLFVVFFCAAVGMTCATAPVVENPDLKSLGLHLPRLNLHNAFLAAASMALVISLVQQIRKLIQVREIDAADDDIRFARRFGIVWRAVVAAIVVACIAVQLLLSRNVVSLPEHTPGYWYDIIPNILWIVCLIVTLSACLRREERKKSVERYSIFLACAIWFAGTILALLLLPDTGLIQFLVHIATQGIEAFQPLKFHRIGTFPDQQSEGFRLFWLSLTSVCCVVLAAAILISMRRFKSTRIRLLCTGTFVLLLSIAAIFCIWYYGKEFYRVSPDMADAGFVGNWFDCSGAAILVLLMISVGAARLARSNSFQIIQDDNAKDRRPAWVEPSWAPLLLLAAAIIYLVEVNGYTTGFARIWEILLGLLQEPRNLLYIALCALCLKLCWLRWRRRKDAATWKISGLNRRRFVWNLVALAILIAVAVPTISIYCFVFWLGPWYLYGPK